MRYIFVDEAGTSNLEPITLVVGIVAHADSHVMLAEGMLNEILGAVPFEFREGFIFHATEVWNSEKYRDAWRMTDRLNLLGDIMRIPRRLCMSISVGMVRRESEDDDHAARMKISKSQFQHLLAFMGCLGKADKYIREYAAPNEVATVIAEDVPEMRKYLRMIPKMLSKPAPGMMALSARDMVRPTARDREAGYIDQVSDMRITRIRKSLHFVEKDEEPLLQIADACAFGLRRFFSGREHGPEFAHAILGGLPNADDYTSPSSFVTFMFHPDVKILSQPWFTG